VHLALAAQEQLAEGGVAARVVSVPSWELFAAQPAAYRDLVLPPHVKARVSIEAGVTLGWERYVGADGMAIGLDRFGASAPYQTIYEKLGLTAEAVTDAARKLIR
jgi:transketolase